MNSLRNGSATTLRTLGTLAIGLACFGICANAQTASTKHTAKKSATKSTAVRYQCPNCKMIMTEAEAKHDKYKCCNVTLVKLKPATGGPGSKKKSG